MQNHAWLRILLLHVSLSAYIVHPGLLWRLPVHADVKVLRILGWSCLFLCNLWYIVYHFPFSWLTLKLGEMLLKIRLPMWVSNYTQHPKRSLVNQQNHISFLNFHLFCFSVLFCFVLILFLFFLVSDSCFRNLAEDRSGINLKDLVQDPSLWVSGSYC